MQNILVFQPYLSNRKLSSNTIERQFRFLTKNNDNKVFVLLSKEETDYAKYLENNTKFIPIVLEYLLDDVSAAVNNLMDKYDFKEFYIARTYFTPCTQDIINGFKDDTIEPDDRYWRNLVPMKFSGFNVPTRHIIYDPLEMQYDELMYPDTYYKYSSMSNVDGAKPHNFADIGYYDKNKEVPVEQKNYKFTFGGTAFTNKRAKLIEDIFNRFAGLTEANVFIRTSNIDNLIDNELYEDLTSKSLFTYTIPSQCEKYMSFTRMLLALSQGTIPLVHPDNNLDCLFGKGFEFRESLKDFFEELVYSVDELEELFHFRTLNDLKMLHKIFIEKWHNTEYFKWLQANC